MSVQTLSRGHDSQGKPFGTREVYINGKRCLDNGKVVIGLGLALKQEPPAMTQDGVRIQAELLEPRTESPAHPVLRLMGRFWGWC